MNRLIVAMAAMLVGMSALLGLDTTVMPHVNEPIFHGIGYFMHACGHGRLPSDWDQYLAFMKNVSVKLTPQHPTDKLMPLRRFALHK